ncbi:2-C-methyl-D-erythritol 4-phosphate cytidylyltransferase [Amycolatopsis thermalba]|uniref:2-C-methyl-D-erythritol 4-phosphate cytidylyltransferase n=1 Tax=Amycolatopsis thermalba TaxID=944492 RepID=A0ABY4P2W0_9PSEU|nr:MULTISPECIES: IspD/TarI family cytidylyltransferase [Amycolatopsis]OXM73763.1 2-C-methyl-D-erythritol 4-phosphate cytidylyltransferase [Amycolatopsis sp. KNN50.9b]UQS26624.1 2-C-methyl-D-erythritol 4-phosphate cytidylyltransferase [Amycolatopsis thermalba]
MAAEQNPTAAAVVLASGAGTRVGAGVNKVYLPLAGRPIVAWSLAAFARTPGVGVLVFVIRPQDRALAEEALSGLGARAEIVHGGASRQDSELNALRHLAGRIESGAVDAVLLHDGARPLVTPALITEVLRTAREHGGAMPGVVADDIVTDEGARPPGTLVRAQTPQGFRAAPLVAAYEQAAREGFAGTDTASVMERYSRTPVRWVPGAVENIKVTYPHDLLVAGRILAR